MCSSGMFARFSGGSFVLFVIASFFLIAFPTTINAFNVDLKTIRLFRGPPNSKFGFSVAQHKEHGISWLIIGAPEAVIPVDGVDKRGGAVYRCNPQVDDECDVMIYSKEKVEYNKVSENRTQQWLGATVRTSGVNGVVLACAPRYAWYGKNGDMNKMIEPVGSCYLSSENFTQIQEFSPCRHRFSMSYSRQGYCQAGIDASITEDSNKLFIGAVGSFYWQGEIFSTTKDIIYFPNDFEHQSGQVMFVNTAALSTDVKGTKEGAKEDDDTYLGYSVAAIKLNGSTVDGVVVGRPRARGQSKTAYLTGKVIVYTSNLLIMRNLTGEQLGSYFGYSVCVADVDGDGNQDIIVGAPFYTPKNNEKLYEVGRVYVFYQGGRTCRITDFNCWENTFKKNTTIDGGTFPGARFGTVVASLGDINKDGYEDFAVGAPYETEKGFCVRCYEETPYSGAIYIYHGSAEGVRKVPSQELRARDVAAIIGLKRLNGFGFSIGGGFDLDDNLYPDVTIGAYESDIVYHLRSKPVVRVSANLTFLGPSSVDLSQYAGSTVFLRLCLMYNGVGVDENSGLDTTVLLDSLKSNSSRLMYDRGFNVIREPFYLTKDGILCKEYPTIIKTNIRDKLTPIVAELHYTLITTGQGELGQILEQDHKRSHNAVMLIKNNCGSNHTCIPDLHVQLSSTVDKYTIGSGDKLILNVTVENRKDDSFETKLYLYLPSEMSYVNVEDLSGAISSDITIYCSLAATSKSGSADQKNLLICDLGNPLPSKQALKFGLILQPIYGVSQVSRYDFQASVNSTNPESNQTVSDNVQTFILPIWENTSLSITGESYPKDIHFKYSDYYFTTIQKDIQAGPPVDHKYTIFNLGPSDVSKADVYIYWPSHTHSGEHLLYLLDEPQVEGNITCSPVSDINPEKLELVWDKKDHGISSSNYSVIGSSTSYYNESSYSEGGTTVTQFNRTVITSSSNETVQFGNWSSGGVTHQEFHHSYNPNSINKETAATGGKDIGKDSTEKILLASGGEAKQSVYDSGNSAGEGYAGRTSGGSVRSEESSAHSENRGNYNYGNGRRHGNGRDSYSSQSEGEHVATKQESYGGASKTVVESSRTGYNREGEAIASGPQLSAGSVQVVHGFAPRPLDFDQQNYYNRYDHVNGARQFGGASDARLEESHSGTVLRGGGVSGGAGGRAGDARLEESHSGTMLHGGGARGSLESAGRKETVYKYTDDIDEDGAQFGHSGSGLRKNKTTTFREYNHSYNANTNWDESGVPKTVSETRWVLNKDGNVRNGSYSRTHQGLPENYPQMQETNLFNGGGGGGGGGGGVGGEQYSSIAVADRKGGAVQGLDVHLFGGNNGAVDGAASNADRSNSYSYSSGDADSGSVSGSRRYVVKNYTSFSQDGYRVNGETGDNRRHDIHISGMRDGQQLNGLTGAPIDERVIAKGGTLNINDYVDNEEGKADDEENEGDDNEGDENEEEEEIRAKEKHVKHKREIKISDSRPKKEDCGSAKCTVFKCTVNQLDKNKEAVIVIRSLVWLKTIQKMAYNREMTFSSKALVKITEFPHIGKTNIDLNQTFETFTNATSDDIDTVPNIVPLWIVVISAIVGTLILLLLVYLLYKCGFFKRNRPNTGPESQPLNRNGQIRDEHL